MLESGDEFDFGRQPQQAKTVQSATRALDAMRSQQHPPITINQDAESDLPDHASAYAEHAAAIEAASTVLEWQNAYTVAYNWATSTGDENIKAGIKQLAGESKRKLSATAAQ